MELKDDMDAREKIILAPKKPEKTAQVGSKLSEKKKAKLIVFLKDKMSCFVWDTSSMPGIDPNVITHKLNMDRSFKPVKQKMRTFAPKKNHAINEDVDRLMANKMIEDVHYPNWLANTVVVKKRMERN